MTTTDHPDRDAGWEHLGRAAEHFARRVARDAGKFAEHLQEHAGEFAEDVSRDWRRAERVCRRGCRRAYREATGPEVREVFEDIRGVLTDVLAGVDELIQHVFSEPSARADADDDWVRVVSNRDAECAGCRRAIAAGDEAFVRRTAEGKEFRCVDCGVPSSSSAD